MADAESEGIAGLPPADIEVAPVGSRPDAPLGSRPDAPHGPPPEWPLALLLAVVAIAGAWGLISSEWGKGGPQKAAAAVADHGSMFDVGRFPAALERIAAESGGSARVPLMRVDAAQVWTVLRAPDGRHRVVRLRVDGKLSSQETAAATTGGPRLDQIHSAAPSTILRELQHRHGVDRSRVDFLTFSAGQGAPPAWSAFLLAEEGALAVQYRGDARGKGIERVR